MMYRTCAACGSNLDLNERCDCEEVKRHGNNIEADVDVIPIDCNVEGVAE